VPLPPDAPAWAAELALAYESGAHGQFVLHGNVQDRLPVDGELVNLARYLEEEVLAGFPIVLTFDLGNGLRVARGGETLQRLSRSDGLGPLPREPQEALAYVARTVRTLANLRAVARGGKESLAFVVRGADHVLPGAGGFGHEHGGLVSLVRDLAGEPPFTDLPFATFLIAENLNDLHPQVAFNPRVARIRVPLPGVDELTAALGVLRAAHPRAFDAAITLEEAAGAFCGVSVASLESLVKQRAHEGRPLAAADWVATKKALVEREASGLVEFLEPRRTFADYHGQEALKDWLRQDVALWRASDLRALPMGYLVCGPVGTGKTYLVECLAGEAGVPVVKLKNFRDRWVGSSEGNLERIFRLVRALGRCIVFVDEADQALGKRDAGTSDGGLSGRLYAMIAQEMADGGNRGRIMWVLASSRPDLIEVDLKRPGRVDVKVPILPTTTAAESAALLQALLRRYGLSLSADEVLARAPPTLLTPGAAEAIAVKVYRMARTGGVGAAEALGRCLAGWQNPIPLDVLEFQMRIAVREATDLAFVPEPLRRYAATPA
jgi:hypothetical protein